MITCTKCGGSNILEKNYERETPLTMDDFAKQHTAGVPLVYKMTTLRCDECGYEVSF